MMNQEDIFKKIGHILNELNDQYQYLAQNPAELNELELELFLANSSFLADHVQIILKLNHTAAQKVLPQHTTSTAELPTQHYAVIEETNEEEELAEPVLEIAEPLQTIPVLEEPVIKTVLEQEMFKLDNDIHTFEFILNENPSSDRFEFEEKSIDEIFDRPLSKEEEEIIAQKQKLRESDSLGNDFPEEDEIGPEPFLVSAVDEPAVEQIEEPSVEQIEETIAKIEEPAVEIQETEMTGISAFQQETAAGVQDELISVPKNKEEPPVTETISPAQAKLTLNDILSGNTQAATTRMESSRPPVTDLKQAISLNDKLRYIRDLFNGYNLAYAEAIDLLNKMPDFKSADSFLQKNYASKHNWADKQETVDQFYELLNQRFPAK